MKPKIADYITRVPVTASAEQTIAYARTLMLEHKIRHLPVVDGDKIVGVVSHRDLLVLETANADCEDLALEKAMRSDPFVVEIDSDLAVVAREMSARRIGSSVVTSDGTVVGMFTTTDALNALAAALAD